MFTLRKRSGGNRYTFVSILLILLALYVFRLVTPAKEVAYPDILQYDSLRYQYTGTIKGSPIMYARSKPASSEGHLILVRRGIKKSEEIYIYEGYLRYRRYVVLKE